MVHVHVDSDVVSTGRPLCFDDVDAAVEFFVAQLEAAEVRLRAESVCRCGRLGPFPGCPCRVCVSVSAVHSAVCGARDGSLASVLRASTSVGADVVVGVSLSFAPDEREYIAVTVASWPRSQCVLALFDAKNDAA